MNASIRVYEKEEFATFRQHFHTGFTGMSLNNDYKVTTAFPSIQVPKNSELKYINPCDEMAGWIKLRKGKWDVKNMTYMCGDGSEAYGFRTEVMPIVFFYLFVEPRYRRCYAGSWWTIFYIRPN